MKDHQLQMIKVTSTITHERNSIL